MILSFKKKYTVISIWHPRYHDKVVLISTSKVGERNKVIIERGAYQGEYFVAGVVASACKIGSNGRIPCYEVPISMLERI